MIIWIDGTYGIGKSTTAKEIKKKLSKLNIDILDSDVYYQEMIIENRHLASGGTLPQNNKNFITRFKNIIETKSEDENTILIVVMALTMKECKAEIFDDLIDIGKDILHFILDAEPSTITFRISNNEGRDKNLSLDYLNENISFLKNNFSNAIFIKTDGKNADKVADEIISISHIGKNDSATSHTDNRRL